MRMRVIPVLLLDRGKIYKTKKFRAPQYVGDAINSVRIFNDLCVDELIILDFDASRDEKKIDVGFLRELASECFVPICYGGGIKTAHQAEQVLNAGFEKISLNSAAIARPQLVQEVSSICGSQSVVCSIDVKRDIFGIHRIFSKEKHFLHRKMNPIEMAKTLVSFGAGEILLNSVDRDGTGEGYDLDILREFVQTIDTPLIICGGAAGIHDFKKAAEIGASGAAAGKCFIYFGKYDAVLLNYPSELELEENLQNA